MLAAPILILAASVAQCPEVTHTVTGDDVTARFFHAATSLGPGVNDRIMVSGGMLLQIVPPSLVSLDSVAFFDPGSGMFSNAFVPTGGGAPVMPELSVARSSHTQTTMSDGRVLITGGNIGAAGTNPGTPTATVEIFDPVDGSLAPGPPMSQARAAHTATALGNGRILVVGGATWQAFDPALDEWSGAFALEHARTGHAAVHLGGQKVLVAGGSGGGGATLEVIDVGMQSSTVSPALLPEPLDDLRGVSVPDGGTILIGGQKLADGDTVPDVWRFDPVTDMLDPLPDPPGFANGVADHQLISSGRLVLLAGGESQVAGEDTELDCAAIFDAASDTWIWSGTMIFPHDDFAAVLMANGAVLLIDGGAPFFGQEAPTRKTESFAVDTWTPADLDGDGSAGFGDLLRVLGAWGTCADGCYEDLDGDGNVGFGDILTVLGAWGGC